MYYLIGIAVCLGLVLALLKRGHASGEDKSDLKHSIKANKAKDELLEFKKKEKDFIAAMHAKRVIADSVSARKNKSDS